MWLYVHLHKGCSQCLFYPIFHEQLKSMMHNINFFLDSLVKGDLKEVKGVSLNLDVIMSWVGLLFIHGYKM